MGELGFLVCRALGRMLRGGRYSRVRIVSRDGVLEVRKKRLFYAPLLVWLGGPVMRSLDTGVRVLPRRDWVERERLLYQTLYNTPIGVEVDGTLVLNFLHGETLAALLENPALLHSDRLRAVELAVVALAAFHEGAFTHGDAMAENVMIDLDAGVARWFDFETEHEERRPVAWCRGDDLRALLATVVLRTPQEEVIEMLQLIVDTYPQPDVTRLLPTHFAPVLKRPLVYHLGQAGLSLEDYREIGCLLRVHVGA